MTWGASIGVAGPRAVAGVRLPLELMHFAVRLLVVLCDGDARNAYGHHDTGNAAVPAWPPPGEAADASNHDQACLNSTSPEADWIGSVRVRGG